MPVVQIPLPTISHLPDGRILIEDENGTGIVFSDQDELFDLDDLTEIKGVIEKWLFEQGLNYWWHYFDPSQQAIRDQYEAQGSIQIRRRNP